MDGDEEVQPRSGTVSVLARISLLRGEQSHRHRQGELFPERGRITDGRQERSGAAGPETLQSAAVKATPRMNDDQERRRASRHHGRIDMLHRGMMGLAVLVAMLGMAIAHARAFDQSK